MHLFLLFVALFFAVSWAIDCGEGADLHNDTCLCLPGFYHHGPDQSCTKCSPGRTNDHMGSKECDICDVGYVKALGSDKCTMCPEGTTTVTIGQSSCDHCVDGYYGSNNGRAPCFPCPSGYTTNAAMGHRDCIACVGPTFNCRSFLSRDSREEIINNLARAIDSINAAIKEIYSNLMYIQRRLDYRHVDEEYKQSIEHG